VRKIFEKFEQKIRENQEEEEKIREIWIGEIADYQRTCNNKNSDQAQM
jgi:hypothetical protein